jgi:Spy/CpxP family protein refolding chaperone
VKEGNLLCGTGASVTMSAVFTLGAIVGASSSSILVSRNPASAQLPPHKSKPGIVEKFKTRLKLTPEQTQRLESLLDKTRHEFSQLHLAVKPQFEEIRQKMRSGIRQMLNEEQKREYEAMIRERDEEKSKREKDKIR